jgi:hypothetical protein
MEKICQKIQLKDPKSDLAYWQTQSYQKRLETLEQIRQEYHHWKYQNVQSRLQRVYTIETLPNKPI